MANRWGNNGNTDRLLFSWPPKSLQMVTTAMKLKGACSLGEKLSLRKTWRLTERISLTSWQIDGEKMETGTDFIFLDSKITVDGDCSHEIKRCLLLVIKAMTNRNGILRKQRHYFADKGLSSQSYGFSRSHVWMWKLNHKDWVPKK